MCQQVNSRLTFCPPAGRAGSKLDPMQGTVATFDEREHTGTVLLDDGTEITFDGPAFDASGLRHLRLGQRVKLDHDAAGHLVRLTLPTLP